MASDTQVSLPLAVAPAEAARLMSLGRTRFYELLAAGEIKSLKVGTRRLIRVRDIEDWLERQCEQA